MSERRWKVGHYPASGAMSEPVAEGPAVGVIDRPVYGDSPRPVAAGQDFRHVRAQATRRPWARPAAVVPGLQPGRADLDGLRTPRPGRAGLRVSPGSRRRGAPPSASGADRGRTVGPRRLRQPGSTGARPSGSESITAHGQLAVMGPRPAVQIVRTDHGPDVIDDDHLRMHVDRVPPAFSTS